MATVAISSDFLTAFAALPRHVQGKVTDFVNKFRNDPTSPGINYEKINDADVLNAVLKLLKKYRFDNIIKENNVLIFVRWATLSQSGGIVYSENTDYNSVSDCNLIEIENK